MDDRDRMGNAGIRLRRVMIAVALAVVAVVAYAPAVGLPFVNYDDNEYARNNAHVRNGLSADLVRWAFAEPHEVNYFPLTWMSLAADASMSEPDFGSLSHTMHRTNVALHAAAVAVLFLLLARATDAKGPSAFVAAAFAVHPVHVESVAWVSERKDVLCGLLYLLAVAAFLAFARAQDRRWRWLAYALMLLAAGAALLSKAMAVTLPIVLLVLNGWPLRRYVCQGGTLRMPRAFVEQLPLTLAAIAVSLVTYGAQASAGAVQTIGDRPAIARAQQVPVAYVRYLGKSLWPTDLSPYYPYHPWLPVWMVAGSVALLVGVTIGAARLWRRFPYLLVGWLWFGITLVPVIGIVPAGRQAMADRYMYLPLIGPAIMVAWGARDLLGPSTAGRMAGAILAVSAALVGTALTRRQLGYWADSRTLFAHALAVDPDNAFAHVQLGYLDKLDGQLPSALSHYERAVELDPGFADGTYLLANMLLTTDPARAAKLYRLTLASRPHDARAENNLGVALSTNPARAAEAAELFRAAANDSPGWPDPHMNLGRMLLAHGRPDLAAAEFAAAGRHP